MSTIETDTSGNLEQEGRRYAAQRELEDREPDAIEQEIDATRADMRATLEALERRFSFDRLVDLTVGRIRERGGEFAGNLTDAATQNPMPLLLTSIGLGWMMLTSRRGMRARDDEPDSPGVRQRMAGMRDRARGAADRMHGAAESTRSTLKDAADSTRDTLQSAADSTREAFRSATQSSRAAFEHTSTSLHETADSLRSGASRAASATRDQVEYARERMDRLLHEQPLMLGALGLAAGAIIGALLPVTEHEGRMLGQMRDKAIDELAQKSRATLKGSRENSMSQSAPAGERAGDDVSRGQSTRPH